MLTRFFLAIPVVFLLAANGCDEASDMAAVVRDGPIFQAVRRNELETARRLLQRNPRLANAVETWREGGTVDYDTPLHEALDLRRFEIAELLLQYGADVTKTNAAGKTPLQLAGARDREDLVMLVRKRELRVSP